MNDHLAATITAIENAARNLRQQASELSINGSAQHAQQCLGLVHELEEKVRQVNGINKLLAETPK